jgi:hypothetical protein
MANDRGSSGPGRTAPGASCILAALIAIAASAGHAEAACDSPDHRRFDFWVGHWRVVSPAGELLGHNRIETILDGCALQENWTGRSGYTGRSLNTWDPTAGQWRQFWTDNHDLTLQLEGGWQSDRMVLEGERTTADGRQVTDRISWIPLEDGAVRQHWEQSVDDAGFSTVFVGRYLPVEDAAEAD